MVCREEEDLRVVESRGMFAAVVCASACAALFGLSVGYTSPTLVDTDKCSDFNSTDWSSYREALNCKLGLSDEAKTWFSSTISFGAGAGAVFGGRVPDALGLRIGMCIACLLCMSGFGMLAAVPEPSETCGGAGGCTRDEANVPLLISSRVVVGLGVGLLCTTCPPYLTEVSTIRWRGTTGACFQVGAVLGILLAYLLGLFMHFRAMAVAVACLSLASAGSALLLPESPRWLAARGRRAAAVSSLRRLRNPTLGHECEYEGELEELYDVLRRERSAAEAAGGGGGGDRAVSECSSENRGGGGGGGGIAELCGSTPARRALFISVVQQVVAQFSGVNAIVFYAGSLLNDVFPDSRQTANTWALGLQCVQAVVTVAAAPMMDRAGRRVLLTVAMAGMSVSTVPLAWYYLDGGAAGPSSMRAGAVAGLFAYMTFFSCGLGAIPWAMMGELFPIRVKGAAVSVATAVNWTACFAVTKSLDNLSQALGPSPDPHNKGRGYVFALYGGVCVVGLVITLALVPETKGKSIEQVQRELSAPLCCGGGSGGDEDDGSESKALLA